MLKDRVKQQETITRQVGEKIRDEAQDRVSPRSFSSSLSVCKAIMCIHVRTLLEVCLRVPRFALMHDVMLLECLVYKKYTGTDWLALL